MDLELAMLRRVVDHFTSLVDAVGPEQWDAPTPDEGWNVGDLVAHVVDRDRMLGSILGGPVPDELDGVSEPAELPDAWHERVQWWRSRLDDPEQADRSWQTPFGVTTFAGAAIAFNVSELTVHSWDLARAIGADEALDPDAVMVSFAEFRRTEGNLRRPGVLGDAVPVADDVDEQTRFLAFTGRRV